MADRNRHVDFASTSKGKTGKKKRRKVWKTINPFYNTRDSSVQLAQGTYPKLNPITATVIIRFSRWSHQASISKQDTCV